MVGDKKRLQRLRALVSHAKETGEYTRRNVWYLYPFFRHLHHFFYCFYLTCFHFLCVVYATLNVTSWISWNFSCLNDVVRVQKLDQKIISIQCKLASRISLHDTTSIHIQFIQMWSRNFTYINIYIRYIWNLVFSSK